MTSTPDPRREEALLRAALALGEHEREDFLRVACHSDAAMYRRVLDRLDAHLATDSAAPGPGPQEGEVGLNPGTRVGPFLVGDLLGEGGMGVVHAATDTRLGRQVALKTLNAWAGIDPALRRRLEREAALTAQLQHPYACQVFDVLEHRGVPVLVLERLEGEPLSAALEREGRLPLPRALQVLREAAEALAEAHRLGIVHRDLKPSNLFLTRSGHVKVLDFGIARPTVQPVGDAEALTRPGTAVGTPGYLSPEQASGHVVDAPSDLFSLGIVGFEMISGTNPYRGERIPALARLFATAPPDLAEQAPGTPTAVVALIARLMSARPEDRPAGMAQLALELASLEATLASPDTSASARSLVAPPVAYAMSGKVSLAWQVVGDGPVDLVYVPGWISHLETSWEDPRVEAFYRGLARFSRVILFDKRGTGMSDRTSGYPTLEDRMDDVRAVMDAAGSERAVVLGMSEGGNMSMTWAAAHPERVRGLALFGVFAKRVWSPDYPWGPTPEQREAWFRLLEANWGGPLELETLAPSLAHDEAFRRWWARLLRSGASPGAALDLARFNTQIDVRAILPSIRVPTLIVHRRGDRDVKIEEGRWLARHIPGAKLVELEGDDHLLYAGDVEAVVATLEEFVAGLPDESGPDEQLLTLVAMRGDAEALAIAGEQATHFRAEHVGTAGDCRLAGFDGPARAVRFALTSEAIARGRGLALRGAVHVGPTERRRGVLAGAAVEEACALCRSGSDGAVVVSDAVRALVPGARLVLEARAGAPGWIARLGA